MVHALPDGDNDDDLCTELIAAAVQGERAQGVLQHGSARLEVEQELAACIRVMASQTVGWEAASCKHQREVLDAEDFMMELERECWVSSFPSVYSSVCRTNSTYGWMIQSGIIMWYENERHPDELYGIRQLS